VMGWVCGGCWAGVGGERERLIAWMTAKSVPRVEIRART